MLLLLVLVNLLYLSYLKVHLTLWLSGHEDLRFILGGRELCVCGCVCGGGEAEVF